MRMPIPGIFLFRGVCDAFTGGEEQCIVKPGEELVFLLVLTAVDPCTGMVFTAVFRHQRVDQACQDVVGLNFVGLDMNSLPRPDDVTVYTWRLSPAHSCMAAVIF